MQLGLTNFSWGAVQTVQKLLCPRNEVCVFFLTDYISFLVSPSCRRLTLSHTVSDDCVCPWGFTHLIFLYFYYLSSFSFWNRVLLCNQDGLALTMSAIPVSDSLCFSCPSSHVLGMITGIHSGLYLFLIIMTLKKVLLFLQIPYQITQEELEVQRDLKPCSGLHSQLGAVPRIFCWICRCVDRWKQIFLLFYTESQQSNIRYLIFRYCLKH